ncbi:hypothetical protein FraQA3DRAFT_1454 [Frankia sp. QA3]|nr:hypothetical protein FraQA3DRAFT_1454 [Frankia sp. QA3]
MATDVPDYRDQGRARASSAAERLGGRSPAKSVGPVNIGVPVSIFGPVDSAGPASSAAPASSAGRGAVGPREARR